MGKAGKLWHVLSPLPFLKPEEMGELCKPVAGGLRTPGRARPVSLEFGAHLQGRRCWRRRGGRRALSWERERVGISRGCVSRQSRWLRFTQKGHGGHDPGGEWAGGGSPERKPRPALQEFQMGAAAPRDEGFQKPLNHQRERAGLQPQSQRQPSRGPGGGAWCCPAPLHCTCRSQSSPGSGPPNRPGRRGGRRHAFPLNKTWRSFNYPAGNFNYGNETLPGALSIWGRFVVM